MSGEYDDFPSTKFCPTVPRISVARIVQCFNNFGYRKSFDKRGTIKLFRRKFSVSQCRKFP